MRSDAGEHSPAERLALRREAAPLGVGQSESTSAELLLQDTVLFDEVLDGLGLAAVDPTGEGREEQLKREEVGHRA